MLDELLGLVGLEGTRPTHGSSLCFLTVQPNQQSRLLAVTRFWQRQCGFPQQRRESWSWLALLSVTIFLLTSISSGLSFSSAFFLQMLVSDRHLVTCDEVH